MTDAGAVIPLCKGCWTLLPPGTPCVEVEVEWLDTGRRYTLPYCQACRPDGAVVAESLQQLTLFAEG